MVEFVQTHRGGKAHHYEGYVYLKILKREIYFGVVISIKVDAMEELRLKSPVLWYEMNTTTPQLKPPSRRIRQWQTRESKQEKSRHL